MSTTQVKKLVTAAAVGVAAVGITAAAAVASDHHQQDGASAVRQTAASTSRESAVPAASVPAPAPKSAVVGRGTLGGKPWSVTLQYYATFPDGYTPPPNPTFPTLRHMPTPKGHSLLCTRIVIDGEPEGHPTGPWVECDIVNGPRDDNHTTRAGLHGNTDKATAGNRLFMAQPETAVTHAIVTFRDGTHATADVITVPGTAYRAYAIPITTGQSIEAVDEYDAHNHLLKHDTQWR
ncbi:hypothetical protein [Streptomyces sp. NBC_00079]|uniref:hypothetical protein n=1 Tax=Streptomyces sp. NBC_00079 TaxID=2975644 RepID=UPI0032489837